MGESSTLVTRDIHLNRYRCEHCQATLGDNEIAEGHALDIFRRYHDNCDRPKSAEIISDFDRMCYEVQRKVLSGGP